MIVNFQNPIPFNIVRKVIFMIQSRSPHGLEFDIVLQTEVFTFLFHVDFFFCHFLLEYNCLELTFVSNECQCFVRPFAKNDDPAEIGFDGWRILNQCYLTLRQCCNNLPSFGLKRSAQVIHTLNQKL